MKPRVEIDVDQVTGVWTTDGMPMVYMPRHFFLNNHAAVEMLVGRDRYAQQLYAAGEKSTSQWCANVASEHSLDGEAVFRLYLQRISDRGWGKFTLVDFDDDRGMAEIRLDHSLFVLGQPERREYLCYPFAGWFAGGMNWLAGNRGHRYRTICRESKCAAAGHEACVFSILPAAAAAQN